LSCGDQVQGQEIAGAGRGKAAVVATCLVKNGVAAEGVHLSQHTSSRHGAACRIGRSLSFVDTARTCFLLPAVFPPCRCHMSHYC